MKGIRHAGKLLVPLALAFVAMVGVYVVAKKGSVKALAAQPLHVEPFFLEYDLTSFVQQPSGELFQRRFEGRTADGVTVSRKIFVPPEIGIAETREVSFPDGRSLLINDEQKIKSTYLMSTLQRAQRNRRLRALASIRESSPDCGEPGETLLGIGTVMNRQVKIWQRDTTTADQSVIRLITYRDPQLQCRFLRQTKLQSPPGGSFTTKWDDVAVSLASDPPVELMDQADSYTELLPSEFAKRTMKVAASMDEAVKSGKCPESQTDQECNNLRKGKHQLEAEDSRYLEGRR